MQENEKAKLDEERHKVINRTRAIIAQAEMARITPVATGASSSLLAVSIIREKMLIKMSVIMKTQLAFGNNYPKHRSWINSNRCQVEQKCCSLENAAEG